jgi:outer membrane receptor for monomeric catechols
MTAKMSHAISVVVLCLASGAFASERPQRKLKAPPHRMIFKQDAARTSAADRDPYTDPAAPYKADRLSSSPGEPMLNQPGQTTVLTRKVLDDMNATTLNDAMRSTAGVTVGR